MCILMLYSTVLLIFTPVIVWDTRRVENRKGDCLGICCCAEDTIVCFKGIFLSDKQSAYSFKDKKELESEKKDLEINEHVETNPSD